MGWITKNLPDGTLARYWEPDVLPEPTQEWRTKQSKKTYLKPDGMVTSHPGWFFGNGALATDEYFYFNHEWLTIIDEGNPGEIEEDGVKYIHLENPSNEWENTDNYIIKKTYKKYRRVFTEKPEENLTTRVRHNIIYNHDDLTATDEYIVENLPNIKVDIMGHIKKIRNYFLDKTDYIIIMAKERGLNLSEEFINYRQSLRDVTSIDLESLNLTPGDIAHLTRLSLKIEEFNIFRMDDDRVLNLLSFVPIPNKTYDDPIVEVSEGE